MNATITESPSPTAGISFEALFTQLYDRLKQMAGAQLRKTPDESLAPDMLVHEFFLRVAGPSTHRFEQPAQFLNYASKAMRHILIDRTRARGRAKRSAESICDTASIAETVALDELSMELSLDLELLLRRLRWQAPRAAEIVELHYYGGLSLSEIAQLLALTVREVEREWRIARVLLQLPID